MHLFFFFFLKELGSTVCPRTGEMCNGRNYQRLNNVSDCGPQWFRPLTLRDISAIFAINQSKKIKFLAGDTGKGLSYLIIIINLAHQMIIVSDMHRYL